MIRPTPLSGPSLAAAALGLLLVAPPSMADAPAPEAVEPGLEPAAATPEAPPKTLPLEASATTAPAPPPLDELEIPPAFDTQEAGGFLWSFVKSMLMLGVVLALIYLVLHKGLGRLVQRTQMGRRMHVVERIALDQRRALYLVEVDGEEVLLAATEGGVTAVDLKGPKRASEATSTPPALRFEVERNSNKGGRPPETGKDREGRSIVQTANGNARESAEG